MEVPSRVAGHKCIVIIFDFGFHIFNYFVDCLYSRKISFPANTKHNLYNFIQVRLNVMHHSIGGGGGILKSNPGQALYEINNIFQDLD